MMDMIDVLRTELTGDPLTVGYAGMDDTTAAASLNNAGSGRTLTVDTLSSAQVYGAISTAEFDALTTAEHTAIDRILGLGGDIILTPASKARAVLVAVFGAGTDTRTALLNLVRRAVSRAEELGLPTVREGHVQEARR